MSLIIYFKTFENYSNPLFLKEIEDSIYYERKNVPTRSGILSIF
jgi:hypothetical protein